MKRPMTLTPARRQELERDHRRALRELNITQELAAAEAAGDADLAASLRAELEAQERSGGRHHSSVTTTTNQ